MNIPSPGDVFAAFFAAAPEPEPDQVVLGPCDQPVPYTLTPEAEALLDASAEPEASL